MNLAIFQSIMILTQKGLIEGLWMKTFNVSIWIPLHQSHKPKAMFPKTIPDNVPKNHLRKPKAPLLENIPKTLPSTITQSNVPENLSSTITEGNVPIDKPSPLQYCKALNIDLSTTPKTQPLCILMKSRFLARIIILSTFSSRPLLCKYYNKQRHFCITKKFRSFL